MSKARVVLTFPSALVHKPVTYHLVRDYDLVVNILRAEIRPGEAGMLLMELDDVDGRGRLQEGLEFVSRAGIEVQPVAGRIAVDREACVDCGACVGTCLSGALSLDRNTWELRFDDSRCVLCKVCVESCPLGAISVEF